MSQKPNVQQGGKKKKRKNAKRPPPRKKEMAERLTLASESRIRGKDPLSGYRAMANMVVDPHGSPVTLLPDRVKVGRAVRRFTKTITIKATDAGCTNGFTIIAAPEISMPIFYTGGALPIPAAAPGTINGYGFIEFNPDAVITELSATFNDTLGNKGFCNGVEKTHTETVKCFQISRAAGAPDNLHVSVSAANDLTTDGYAIQVWYAAAGAAAWTKGAAHTMKKGTNDDWEFSIAAACDHVAIVPTTTSSRTHKLKIGFSCDAAQVFTTATSDLGRSVIMQSLDTAAGGRVTAISMLCTNVSPALSRGGTIVAARLPSALKVPNVESLQADYGPQLVHVGDAAKGSYSWWLPTESLQSSYLDRAQLQEELLNTNILYANVSGWAADSVFQIKIAFVVEFLINNPLYEKIEPPLVTAKWERLQQLLGSLPASSCNPDHEGFKEYIKWGTDKASSAVKFVAKHSGELLALAEIIAALA